MGETNKKCVKVRHKRDVLPYKIVSHLH